MRQTLYLIIYVAILVTVSCTGKGGTKHVPQASDSLYTEERVMEIYTKEPQRALLLIDSAEMVGNVSAFRAELLQAQVYAYPHEAMNLDTARLMGVALLEHDSVKGSVNNRMEVLRLLTDIARIHLDYPDQVKWASQLATLCRQQGDNIQALRTESEIGITLTHLGQRNEGIQMLDKIIKQLDSQRHFEELDASIIAMKRKLTALSLLPNITLPGDSVTAEQRQQEIIKLAQRLIAKLDDYEQHPQDYTDRSERQPHKDEVPEYCGFYRSQAYVFLAQAYASSGNHQQAREYCNLFEQTPFGQTLNGRSAISETWRLLGDYDKMLATYDEIDRVAGGDTMGTNNIRQLRGRAEAAAARGDHKASQQYWRRHDLLSQAVNDRLQASEAHHYAARYHTFELETALQKARVIHIKNLFVNVFIGMVVFVVFAVAVCLYRQNRLLREKNRILVQKVEDAQEYKRLYRLLKLQKGRGQANISESAAESARLEAMDDAELFDYINEVVHREQLFLNPVCDRQMLVDRFHLSEKRIGAAFSKGSSFGSVSNFVRDARLEYACQLLRKSPDMPIADIAAASGFSSYPRFATDFKTFYSISPTEYRRQSQP